MTEALEGRVKRLETDFEGMRSSINAGFDRIERLLMREVTDIKNEQIAEQNKKIERLADDQREMWKALRQLEAINAQRVGSSKTINGISHFMSAGLGGLITAIAAYLSSGGKPHP